MKTTNMALLLLLGAGLLTLSCAAGLNPVQDSAATGYWCCAEMSGDSAGFWLGIWHGMIAPVALVIGFFSENVGIYETRNNGGWYNAGFLFGLIFFWGGLFGGTRYVRVNRDGDEID